MTPLANLARRPRFTPHSIDMAGLDPAIHGGAPTKDVDARVKLGHDGGGGQVVR